MGAVLICGAVAGEQITFWEWLPDQSATSVRSCPPVRYGAAPAESAPGCPINRAHVSGYS